MLYQAYQFQSDLMSPLRLIAQHNGSALWRNDTDRTVMRTMAAASEVFSRMRLTHSRPAWRIDSVNVGDAAVPVVEEKIMSMPFGTLLRFRKEGIKGHPPVLLVGKITGTPSA